MTLTLIEPRTITEPRLAECTCCREPRPMRQEAPGEEWAHVNDETYAEVFHVHTESESTDCDGRYHREDVLRINTYNECAGVEDKTDLWRHTVEGAIATYSMCTVEINGEDRTAEVCERHDEGYRNTSLRGCSDPSCAYTDSEFRDFSAEAAGY